MTCRLLGFLIVVTGLGVVQLPDLSADKARWQRDVAVIEAIRRDVLEPYANQSLGDVKRPIVLVTPTLAMCDSEPEAPCVMSHDIETAVGGTKKFLWSGALGAEFQKAAASPGRLGSVPGMATAEWASLPATHPNAWPLLISRPAYVESLALVLVRFARTVSWLVLLSNQDGGWKILRTVVTAQSQARRVATARGLLQN